MSDNAWFLDNGDESCGFRDYAVPLPDVAKHGGMLRLSFDLEKGTAYITLKLDDENGREFLSQTIPNVPMEWAATIAAGVDGWTSAEVAQ